MINSFSDNHVAERGENRRPCRVGYVLKRYPRFSETFIVNEILAHESAGWQLDIFSLRPTTDSHFQHAIADVRAPVTNLRYGGIRAEALWKEIDSYGRENPKLWSALQQAEGYEAVEIFQAILLAREVIARGIEHLHAHFATTASAVARLASQLTGVPYSLTAHAKDIFHESVDEAMLERKLSDASAVITVSDFNVRDLGRRFPQVSRKICRIYNGLNLASYPYCEPNERPAKIVAVGRLVEKKGFSDLIDACAILSEAGVKYECEIIGGGDYENQLREQIGRLNLQDRVSLLGPRPHREAHRAIQEAAVCAVPCITASTGDRDGLPTVIVEAMALGTPCVSTDVTGITEVVRHRETGLVTPERQPVLLADAIRTLLEDPKLRVSLARTARRLIERQFDICENTVQQREVFAASQAEQHSQAEQLDRCSQNTTLAEVG